MKSQTLVIFIALAISVCWDQPVSGQGPTISLDVYRKLANITSVSAFIENMVKPNNSCPQAMNPDSASSIPYCGETCDGRWSQMPPKCDTPSNPITDLLFDARTGSISPIGKNIIIAQIAEEDGCSPRLRSVTIPSDPQQPNILYYPSCVKLMRCGGCCSHDLYECSATSVSIASVSVLKASYPYQNADYFEILGIQDLEMEHHASCECRCRVQPHHCHPTKHQYLPSECRCRCLNDAISGQCGNGKRWDPEQCECVCQHEYYCHEDEEFSQRTCRCEVKSMHIPPVETITSSVIPDNPCATTRCLPGYTSTVVNGLCDCVVEEMHLQAGTNPQTNFGSSAGRFRPGSSQSSSSRTRTRTRSSSTSRSGTNARSTQTQVLSTTSTHEPTPTKSVASAPSGDGISVRQPMVQGRQGHV